jgi:hypothetical protein
LPKHVGLVLRKGGTIAYQNIFTFCYRGLVYLLNRKGNQDSHEQSYKEQLIWFGVNSKKPPHFSGKFAKQPVFGEIAKNHQFWANLFQCALILVFIRLNTISD